jgi:hypothetical protein
LPTPGPLTAEAGVVAAVLAVVVLELDGELLLLPQAASPTLSAIAASAAVMLGVNLPNLLRRLPVIRRLLIWELC